MQASFYEQLKKIPEAERGNFRRAMLQRPQVQGEYQSFSQSYPFQTFLDIGGIRHHLYYWEPKEQPKGLLFMMHGMDGHAGPSGYLARQIVEKNGLVVAALDFRNFGKTKTTDKMGYIGNVQTLIDDAESVLTLLVEKYKTNRIFLAGLSIGGAVAFRLAIRHKFPYVGIILFAPAIKQNEDASPFMKKIAKFVGWFAPTLELNNTGGGGFSIKHKNCRLEQDPLNYCGKIIPGSVRAVLNFQQECSQMYNQLDTPYLLFMGGVDKVVDPFLAVDLERESKTKDKTTVAYKDMWHSIWRSDEMGDVTAITQKWIMDRLQ